MGFVWVHAESFPHSFLGRKQQRPGIASNDNTKHVPTARSSADLTKPNNTPTRHTRAKDKIIQQMVTPQAASSQRTHVSRILGRARTHLVTRRVTTQHLHTQSLTTRRRCGCNDKHKAPCELPSAPEGGGWGVQGLGAGGEGGGWRSNSGLGFWGGEGRGPAARKRRVQGDTPES